jgi:hypothetical protein
MGKESGVCGGGVYFAASPKETNAKAHSKGVVLQARVYMGVYETMTCNGCTGQMRHIGRGSHPNPGGMPPNGPKLQFRSASDISAWLKSRKKDSVLATEFATGLEFIVYQSDQVKAICQV